VVLGHTKSALLDNLLENEANEKEQKLYYSISQFLRSIVYTYRRTQELIINEKFAEEFNKEMEVQTDALYISLIRAAYKKFDLRLRMYLIFLSISNPVVIHAIKTSINLQAEPNQILTILIRLLHDSYIAKRMESLDESEQFKELLVPHLQMSQDINNNYLCQALVTVFDLKLEKWEKNSEFIVITLQEEIIHKIRKDTSLYIDIRLPKILMIKYDTETCTLTFEGDVPTSKLARGGLYLGSLRKIRALTPEEIKQTDGEKQLESTISAGFGVGWALKMLGAIGGTFLLAESTIWWYFRAIKEKD